MIASDFNKIFLEFYGLYDTMALKMPKIDLNTIWYSIDYDMYLLKPARIVLSFKK